uniref:Uncharacterized protein n=1 Tax=Clytia hemisphaerica TaxID=252671 RepID=A0A7M5URM1_9CNID
MAMPEPPPYSATQGYPGMERPNFCSKCGTNVDMNPAVYHCTSCGNNVIPAPQSYYVTPQPGNAPPLPHHVVVQPGNHTPPMLVNTKQPEPVTKQPTGDGVNPAFIATGEGSSSSVVTQAGSGLIYYVVKDNRLIIDFEKVSCCPWQTVGIRPENINQVPQQLATKGINGDQWKKWMIDLMKVQKKAPSVVGCLTIFCCPGFLAQTVLCAMLCPTSMSHPLDCLPCCYGDWYTGLKAWLNDVNAVLNPKDMHAKFMTYKQHSNAPRSRFYADRTAGKKNGEYEMSFLAISLTKSASEKLISESWDHGVNDGCTSGIGRIA